MPTPSRFAAPVVAAEPIGEIELKNPHPFAKNAKGWATRGLRYFVIGESGGQDLQGSLIALGRMTHWLL